jgi:hypothetical protein
MESLLNLFDLLPEGCIANAISFTTPLDACRLSLVASTFRSAADSDAVWDTFLPSDYKDIIARSVNSDANSSTQKPLAFTRKKDLYLHLCDHPLIIDAGTKSFSLDKMSGKKCYMLAARELCITWGDTPMYWKWTSLPESRFGEVAELVKVCWLEIRGKISKRALSPGTTYAAYLVLLKSPEGMHGFEYSPAQVAFGEGSGRAVYLYAEESGPRLNHRGMGMRRQQQVRRGEGEYPRSRTDGWLEVELGEYYVNHDGDASDLEMHVMEVKDLNWKSGLLIQGIEIRPKVATSTAAAKS